MDLTDRKCVPCEGGVPRLEGAALEPLLAAVPGWDRRGDKIHRHLRFRDFAEAMAFVNAMAAVAEAEGHHPDFEVHGWNNVSVTLWTHAAGGLTENDFILAAKIDALPQSRAAAGRAR
jgi:4a-hydroxytetrahydrobiopterin dehydratase